MRTLIALTLSFVPLAAQNVITTVAGADWLFPAGAMRAVEAPLGAAGLYVAAEPQGGFYIADADNLTVMKVGTDGVLHVVAGTGLPFHSGDGGPAVNAGIAAPTGIATDGRGTVYIAFPDRIRKVDPKGVISTVAGTGAAGFSGDGGQAVLARFDGIAALAVDSADALLVADSRNGRIRRIAANGVVTTLASGLASPAGVAGDRSGAVWFTESAPGGSGLLRTISPDGRVSTVETLAAAGAVAVDPGGAVFVSDPARAGVYRFPPQAAILALVAGQGQLDSSGFAGDGGSATSARLNQGAGGIAVNAIGDLFIGDTGNGRVRRVTGNGIIGTAAGNGAFRDSGNAGPAAAATLYQPAGIAADASGNLYVAEPLRNRIRRIGSNGALATIAGTGAAGDTGDGGPAIAATLSGPAAIAADSPRSLLYIADTLNSRIRRLTSDGRLENLFVDGLNRPQGVAVDAAGNLYVADTGNHRIRRIATDGTATLIAGTGTRGFAGEGTPAISASLDRPTGIAVDAAGQSVWFSDSGNGRVRRVLRGVITTVADSLDGPAGLALDRDGVFYVSEQGGHRVRRIDSSGVRAAAGTGAPGYSGDGGPADRATIRSPNGLAVDAAGALVIADQLNHRIRRILTEAPSIRTTPATLSFSIDPGGEDPGVQRFFVASTVPGVSFTAAANRPWVTVEPASAQTPATIEVRIDPARVTEVENEALITVSAPLSSNRQATVTVSAGRKLGAAPGLRIDSDPLSFSLFEKGEAASRTIVVTNVSAEPVAFTSAGQSKLGWLHVSPPAGEIPPQGRVALRVTADPTVLAAATYTGTVAVTGQGEGDVRTLPVTATVSTASQSIFLTHAGLTFTAVAGGAATPPQPVGVVNLGRGSMEWTAAASGLAGAASWLSVSPARGVSGADGSASAEFSVSVNHDGLAAGDYYGQVQVSAGDADNSPQVLLVVLTVLPSGSTPTPVPLPTTLVFHSAFGGPSPGAQTATVYNLTNRTFSFTSGRATVSGGQWLQAAPSAGSLAGGAQGRLLVQPLSEGLPPGVYRGSVTLLFDNGTPRALQVVLIVSGTGPAPRKSPVREAGECAPTSLVPVFTSLASEVAVPAGWPQRLIVRVLDNCGAAVSAGAVSAQFSGNLPPLNLVSLKDGNWAGTWRSRDASPVTIKVKAEVPEQRLSGAAEITTAIRANDTPPVLAAIPVVNAASFVPEAPLAPGMLVRISGSRLSDGEASAPGSPLPVQLAGATVAIAGRAMPILHATADRIDAVVPFDIPVNTRVQMIVQRSGAAAVPENVTVSPVQPAVFTRDGSGAGQGEISKVGPDGALTLADSSNPVSAGDTIAIRCTGLGAVDAGSKVVAPVTVTVGGVAAEVLAAEALPDAAGVYVVRAKLGPGTPAGDAVELVASTSPRSSAPVTLAVR